MHSTSDPPLLSDDVVVVGELTLPSDPFEDDHFLVVIYRSGAMSEVPARIADDLVLTLQRQLGLAIEFRLANVTDAASRVIFPAHLAEHAMYDFTFPRRNILRTIWKFGNSQGVRVVTDEVQRYVAQQMVDGRS